MTGLLRIVPGASDGEPVLGVGAKVFNGDREVGGIARIVVTIAPDELVRAELTAMPTFDEIWAEPFMSEESFLAAAERYGYEVRKK